MKEEHYSVTEFRANIYSMIDEMLETGKPLLLQRNQQTIEVKARKPATKAKRSPRKINDLSKIKPANGLVMPAEWYISPQLNEWKPFL